MARKCAISGKVKQAGNRVSHANNRSKHFFGINLQSKRIFDPESKKFIRLRLSTNMIRTIDKIGLNAALKKHKVSLKDISAQ
ncbi:MAG: 50S ribosomal protein L28 [bacterium]|nr:50S ribosomal protein L28 [bacterium]